MGSILPNAKHEQEKKTIIHSFAKLREVTFRDIIDKLLLDNDIFSVNGQKSSQLEERTDL